MFKPIRTVVVLAGLVALAATSQATIVITPLDASVTVNGHASNVASITPPQLSMFAHGAGVVSDTGGFTFAATPGLDLITVTEVDGYAIGGTVSLTVLLNGSTVLYNESATDAALAPVIVPDPLGGPTSGLVTYTATYTGASTSGFGYLGGFAVNLYQPVPEPAAIATFGVGIMGLLVRRRRSGK